MKKSVIYLAVLTLLAACNKVESPVPSQESDILKAQIEQETATKTYMDANNNIRWSEGDQVVAFMKTSLGLKYQIRNESVGKTSGYFSKVSSGSSDLRAGIEWEHNIVYYPYSEAIETEKTGSNYALSVILPSEQNYAAASFGNGAMAMVAVSEDSDITFKNILGGMKLQLKGTQKVKSITLQGKNNEKLSGAAVVTAYTDETKPAITMAQSASTSVTLDCGSGVQLNESSATEFILALPPVVFTKGFTVSVIDTESNTYTVETDKTNTVIRSSLLVMPAVQIGDKFEEEDNYSNLFLADRNTFEHYFNTFEEAYYYSEPMYQLVWDGELDFKSLAIVCEHREGAESHSILDIKDRSDLQLCFYVANEIFDENQYVLTNNGSIFETAVGKESIGRMPIVLITLIDNNQNVICRGYVKIEIVTDRMPDLTYELSVPDIVYDPTKTEYIGDQWISKDITINSPFNDMWFRGTLFNHITDGYSVGLYPDEFSYLYKRENSSVIKIYNNGSVEHDMPEPYFINEYNDTGSYIFGIEWKFNHKELGDIDKSGTVFKGEITLQNTLKSSEFPMNLKLIIKFKVTLPE